MMSKKVLKVITFTFLMMIFTKKTLAMSCYNFSGNYRFLGECEIPNRPNNTTLIIPGEATTLGIHKNADLSIIQKDCDRLTFVWKNPSATRNSDMLYSFESEGMSVDINDNEAVVHIDRDYGITGYYKAILKLRPNDQELQISAQTNLLLFGLETDVWNRCQLKKQNVL